MTTQRKWLWLGGAVAAAAAALALGVPPLTLLLLALILGCPLAMYYLGMSGHTMGPESTRDGMPEHDEHSDRSVSKPTIEDPATKRSRAMGEK
ncbi:MAG: hypothetical protein LLH30_19435 [Candidatus Manganitrophus sp. SA1]|nr:hypothetical protein [Candidatus Manganitrophus morganii]